MRIKIGNLKTKIFWNKYFKLTPLNNVPCPFHFTFILTKLDKLELLEDIHVCLHNHWYGLKKEAKGDSEMAYSASLH